MVASVAWSSYVLQAWFFSLLAFVNSRRSFLEVFEGESYLLQVFTGALFLLWCSQAQVECWMEIGNVGWGGRNS